MINITTAMHNVHKNNFVQTSSLLISITVITLQRVVNPHVQRYRCVFKSTMPCTLETCIGNELQNINTCTLTHTPLLFTPPAYGDIMYKYISKNNNLYTTPLTLRNNKIAVIGWKVGHNM